MPSISDIASQWGQSASQGMGNSQQSNSGSYLWNENIDKLGQKGDWWNYNQALGYSNLANITDFNSPMYRQYQEYLQKTTPQIGVNTLLAPLMAGGASYGGAQAIAGQRATAMAGQRQDKIQTGVQGFASAMQGQVGGMIGQLQGNLMSQQQLAEQRRQSNATPWGQIGGAVGSIAAAPFTGGTSLAALPGISQMSPTMQPMTNYATQGTPSMGSPGGWY